MTASAGSNRAHPYASRPVAGTHVWLTPPTILARLGRFDIDPCAAPEPRPWNTASRHITLPEDGLAAEWNGRVWCNPPFGANTWLWLERMADHASGIALAFARTDTDGFHRTVWDKATGLLFLRSRPHFHLPNGEKAKGNSGGPIVLIAYSNYDAGVLLSSGIDGKYVGISR